MSDIYVAGDVHGNYKGLIESLMAAGWNEGTDKLVFVGDVVDRGKENAKVVNFIAEHPDTVHLVLGNHEYEHRQMLRYYKALAQSPTVRKLAAWVFLHYKQGEHIFRTKEELETLRCSMEERKKILAARPHTFAGWQKLFITYTLAWENDGLWQMVVYLLDNMCGTPYEAEHTIYEYLSGTKKTRENFEVIFENQAQELNITPTACLSIQTSRSDTQQSVRSSL